MKPIEEYTTDELVSLYKKLTVFATTWWIRRTRMYKMTEEEKELPLYNWIGKHWGGSIYGLTPEEKAIIDSGGFLPESFGWLGYATIEGDKVKKYDMLNSNAEVDPAELQKLDWEITALDLLCDAERWVNHLDGDSEEDVIYDISADYGLATDSQTYQFIYETLQYLDINQLGKLLKFADDGYRSKWEKISSKAGRKSRVCEIRQIDLETGNVTAIYKTRNDLMSKTGIKKSHLAQCIKSSRENPDKPNEWKKWIGEDGKKYGFVESQ